MSELDDKNKRVEQEVERAIAGLYGLPNLEADPYFYSRVQRRLSRRDAPRLYWVATLVQRYRLQPVLLAAAIVVNLATVLLAVHNTSRTETRDVYIESISNQYSVDVSTGFTEDGNGQS
jgi:hypothetical protein